MTMSLLPPQEGVCPVCAVDHPDSAPHNCQSLYYQMRFHSLHGRWPTWADALAHCAPDVREAWREQLVRMGAWSEPADSADIIADPPAESLRELVSVDHAPVTVQIADAAPHATGTVSVSRETPNTVAHLVSATLAALDAARVTCAASDLDQTLAMCRVTLLVALRSHSGGAPPTADDLSWCAARAATIHDMLRNVTGTYLRRGALAASPAAGVSADGAKVWAIEGAALAAMAEAATLCDADGHHAADAAIYVYARYALQSRGLSDHTPDDRVTVCRAVFAASEAAIDGIEASRKSQTRQPEEP